MTRNGLCLREKKWMFLYIQDHMSMMCMGPKIVCDQSSSNCIIAINYYNRVILYHFVPNIWTMQAKACTGSWTVCIAPQSKAHLHLRGSSFLRLSSQAPLLFINYQWYIKYGSTLFYIRWYFLTQVRLGVFYMSNLLSLQQLLCVYLHWALDRSFIT